MKSMKTTLAFLFCACVLAGATASAFPLGKASPDEVALKVFEGVRDGKLEQVKPHCTETAAEFFELAIAMAEGQPRNYTFKVVGTQIDGNSAVVTLRVFQPGEETRDEGVHLTNADGKWKVDDILK